MHSISTSSAILVLIAMICIESSIAIPVPMDSDVLKARADKPLPVKAGDLKTSGYRKTALSSNPAGAYVPSPGGGSVSWDPNAKGDAEHIVEPGAHISKPVAQAGLGPSAPVVQDLRNVVNDPNDLSMLENKANIAKSKLAANPGSNPQNAPAAQSYLAQPDVKAKAKKTVTDIKATADRHGQSSLGQAVEDSVAAIIPSVKKKQKRELEEAWEYARSLEDLLDELD